ncbi:tyrosine-type recombinase/integrase [Halobacillus karajensis]|uniref:Prophage phiRv2 integrase n=1 Tax=Halobacillus karajensis TaxID=195088 RepID=A0A059NWB2_9BACI|nr:site-specific integrase [Halobacillus karajensis]CDQ22635.1 Putative prophage phiRv2 integrase [Halobacillus karajensis]CDQ26117.1 Putative prophage phiRv2 integrase [Halobacillus karajensis]
MPVYKDKQRGTWYYAKSVKTSDGKYKQLKKRGFKKKKDAQEAENEAVREFSDESNLTFKELSLEYLTWYEKRRKESSVKVIRNILHNHLIPEFGGKETKKITPRDVMKYQNKIIDDYAGDFLDKIHTTLSALFNYGIRTEVITTNPAKIAGNFPKKKKSRINFWELDEFRQFIEVVEEEPYRTFFFTLYYSGARKGELLALTWNDILFDQNSIDINKTLDYKGNRTSTKTDSSTRVLLMPGFVMDMLRELKPSYAKDDYVVFGDFYDVISTTTLDRRYAKFIKESGVKRIVMHEFRHSHASYLINEGVTPGVVAERLGHKSVATTLDTYSHLYPDKQIEAVARMENDF